MYPNLFFVSRSIVKSERFEILSISQTEYDRLFTIEAGVAQRSHHAPRDEQNEIVAPCGWKSICRMPD